MITTRESVQKEEVPVAARLAVAAYFFANGSLLATWATRIPAIQGRLDLRPRELGVALLGMAIGALLAMNLSGYLAARFGSRTVVFLSAGGFCLVLPLLALAPNLPLLIGALFLFGAGNGAMDVAMNTQGVEVERAYRRPILTSFHALFSFGGLSGALVSGFIASQGVDPLPHFLVASLIGGLIIVLTARYLLKEEKGVSKEGETGHKLKWPSKALLALGLVAFCSVVGEGAMADWSASYLFGTLHTGAGVAAIGYAVFSLAMAGSRSVGDFFTARFGPGVLVRAGGAIAAVGLTLALVSGLVPLTLLGFGLVGVGLSVIFPITMSAAGRIPGQAAGTAIATVGTCGYFGFLAGPPIIGFVADAINLRLALGIVVVLSLLIVILAGTVNLAGHHKQES